MIGGDTKLFFFLPVFTQKDIKIATGAKTTFQNNCTARKHVLLSKHPKAKALSRKLFSFCDLLKLKVMWQLSSLNIQTKFAATVGDLVVARVDFLNHKSSFDKMEWIPYGGSPEIVDPKNELEIILQPKDGEILQGYRFPNINNYPLKDSYIVVPADKLFRQTFLHVIDLCSEGKLETDWKLMQTSYTEEETAEIWEEFQSDICLIQEGLIIGIQRQFEMDKK